MGDSPMDQFRKSLIPEPLDKTKVSGRKADILAALKASPLTVVGMLESGSWSHGTAIAGKSDVDYLAIVAADKPKNPSTALNRLKEELVGSHSSIYKLTRSSPTIKVEFFTSPDFEIVPAYGYRDQGDDWVLHIPGPNDEWIESAPISHNGYVNKQKDRLGAGAKSLIRLVKAWKYANDVPVSSFYLEMRTAHYLATQDSVSFHYDLEAAFKHLLTLELRSMNDPCGIVGRIPATSSEANRVAAKRALEKAAVSADKAYSAWIADDSYEYWSNMTDIFGTDWPYGTLTA